MRLFFLIVAILVCMPCTWAAEKPITRGSVVVVPVAGAISEAQFFFLRRIVKAAESAGAAAIIFDMDTPGGELKATERIVQMLSKSTIPAYTYVNTNAGSAGALIAIGSKKVFMAPVSAIGAAAPVVGSGEAIPVTMNAKIVSYYSGYFRSVAEKNGYYPQLVDGFINLDKEVKIGDEVINPKGALLTLSAQEAVREVGGRPLLASGIADDVKQVAEMVGLASSEMIRIEPSGFEKISQWITMFAPLLLLGGAIGAYLEFKSPGFGVAGTISALCFLLFFTGHYIAGLTGLEVVAIFGLGVLLVVIELVFFPGVIVVAATGVALMVGSLFFAMVDFYPTQPFVFSFDLVARPMANLGIAIIATIGGVSLLARFLPDLPIFRRLMLAKALPLGSSLPRARHHTEFPEIGDAGVVVSTLRPSGAARIGAKVVDVVADGEFLEAGTSVRVTAVEGKRIVVTRSA